jgi:hypothetical protein
MTVYILQDTPPYNDWHIQQRARTAEVYKASTAQLLINNKFWAICSIPNKFHA